MTAPAVTVVLPTRNRAEVLPRAMRSVLAQTVADLELLVVDDGSTDDTERVVNGFADNRVRYLRNTGNHGVGAARNAGIQAARAPLIAFQDSDDEWRIGKLARQLAAMDVDRADVVCGGYVVLARGGAVRYCGADARMQAGDWTAGNILDFRFIAPTWLARRTALDEAGLFDEALPNLEDWELAFRLFRAGRVVALDEPLLVKHGSADGLNMDLSARIRSLERILTKHQGLWHGHPRARARLQRMLGHSQCLAGQRRTGIANLGRAVRLAPRDPRGWAYWAAAHTGEHGYRRLLRVGR